MERTQLFKADEMHSHLNKQTFILGKIDHLFKEARPRLKKQSHDQGCREMGPS